MQAVQSQTLILLYLLAHDVYIMYTNSVVLCLQEKKFYLYALYNKNKPNSDSLMSEYGSAFFKVRVMDFFFFLHFS